MRGIRQWLTSAALIAGGSVAVAQAPAPLPTPVTAPTDGLPAGTVVSSPASSVPAAKVARPKPPVVDVTIMQTGPSLIADTPPQPAPAPRAVDAPMPPIPMPPKALPKSPMPAGPITEPPIPASPPPPAATAILPGTTPAPVPTPGGPVDAIFAATNGDYCCGPIGAHGPVGQEVFVRAGITHPMGSGLLAENLKNGWMIEVGGRSNYFNSAGDAAWVLEPEITYSFNKGKGIDITTFRGEPTKVDSLVRWSAGLGVGRDYFLSRPGFIMDQYDANFRLGFDAGGRWGTGHVNLTPISEVNGYRRHHDVFGQAFGAVTGTVEIPVGAYTALFGGRVEWDYTFSDFISKGSSFQEVNALFTIGVRY
jgi:hypothetical protein